MLTDMNQLHWLLYSTASAETLRHWSNLATVFNNSWI